MWKEVANASLKYVGSWGQWRSTQGIQGWFLLSFFTPFLPPSLVICSSGRRPSRGVSMRYLITLPADQCYLAACRVQQRREKTVASS